MPRVIFYTATTLNGFLADDHDSLDWLFAVPGGEGGDADFQAFLDGIGVLVQGSATYRWVVDHEDLIAHPEKWPGYYGDRPTWVFTSRDQPIVPGVDVRFASGAVTDAWPQIRDAAGDKDVWVVGGGDLAGQFADAGLLDEVRVSIAPATLASGKPLLPRVLGADRLELTAVRQSGAFAELTYRVTSARTRRMSERWRGVLAALLNPDLRAVLAETMAAGPLPETRRRRAVERLRELGLVRETVAGDLEFDAAAVRGILSENLPVKPTGPARFLDAHGRIDRYPANHGEREELLRWVVDRAFGAGEVLAESQANERLSAFTADVAVLRRYLVDAGLLERTRSGSEYARPAASD